MKKYFILLLIISPFKVFAQTNIAVPSYSATTSNGGSGASTGNIKFYLNGTSHTLNVARGVNGVCFYGTDMFVAIDDGLGTKGIIWYANVSFSSGSFTSDSPVILANGEGTFSVAADAIGNIYSANNNGTVTKFIRNNIAPFYSGANVVNTIFWENGGFAEASGVFVDTDTQTLWAVSYANNQGAVVKLSDFDYADGFGNNGKIKRFADNNLPNTLLQKPEGIAKDADGNIWIANNNNNFVLRLNNSVVTSFISDLNAEDYSFVTLNTTQLNDFAVSANGNQLGGLVYDNLYSSKMYVNDQQSGGNTFVYSFIANNSTPTFSATAMTQIYPGAGQCAIIPCELLPTPNNPIASGATINSGQTATLTASGCAADQTYLWQQAGNSVGTNSSFTTPNLNTTTIYTAHCLRGGTCESNGINVTVNVNQASTGETITASIDVITPIPGGGTRTDARTFRFRLPVTTPDCNLPVLLAFHGHGGTGGGMETSTGFSALADANNFIAVYPDKLVGQTYFSYRVDNPAYLDGQIDSTFTLAIIDYLYERYGINKNRVYATGHSSGAAFVYFLTAKLPNSIAAFAPVAGFPQDYSGSNIWSNKITNVLNPKLPILHIHGTADNTAGTQFTSTNLPSVYPSVPTNNNSNPYIWPMFQLSNKSCSNGSGNYTAAYFQGGNTTVDNLTFCPAGGSNKEVSMMIVRNMGHSWPNSIQTNGIDGSLAIWNFVKDYQLSNFSSPSPTISPQSVNISSGSSTTLTASGCGNLIYKWSNNQTGVSISVSPTSTTVYSVLCKSLITDCTVGGVSNSSTVTVGGCSSGNLSVASTVPATISDCGNTEVIYLKTGQSATLTVSGCLGTLSWSDAHGASGSDASIPITAPSLVNQLGANYINIQCSSGPLCNSFALVTILNQFATDDFYSTPLNTPIEGNVVTNDLETSVALGAYMVGSPAHGTIIWTMSSGRPTGAFVYTPNTGYVGKDTITYYDSDDLTCSKRANLIITVTNPCYNFLSLSGSQMTNLGQNKVFQVSESIVTEPYPKIILNSGNSDYVTFQAGKFVQLSPGFEVSSGAFFTAKIGPCVDAPQTFYTQGKDIYAPNGQKMILKGVNYPVLDDWDFPASDLITEIEKSGANAVRLSWYIDYPSRPTYTLTDLDNLLTKCKNNRMVPILDIHDFTCEADMSLLNTAVTWWTNPAVVAILNKHKQYLIINLANELGQYRWPNYSQTNLNNWKNAYLSAITAVRAANLKMPIMIDGTDCGSDMKAFHQVGPELISHDPEHNIIFSAHAYWYYYPDQVADLNEVVAANLPLYFGEIANWQSEFNNNGCVYNLGDNDGFKYQDLLTYCQTNQIGWAAWAWVRDQCSFRNMTSNNPNAPYGGYNTLTPYGQDIVNNATYGIKNTAVRASIFP